MYSPDVENSSVSLRIGNSCHCDSLTRVWGTLGEQTTILHMLQGGLRNQAKHLQRVHMWHIAYVVVVTSFLGWGTESPNLNLAKFKTTAFSLKLPNLMPTEVSRYTVCWLGTYRKTCQVSPGPVFRVLHVGLGTGLLVYNDVSKGGGLSPLIRSTLLAMWVHAKATPCGLCGLTFYKCFTDSVEPCTYGLG